MDQKTARVIRTVVKMWKDGHIDLGDDQGPGYQAMAALANLIRPKKARGKFWKCVDQHLQEAKCDSDRVPPVCWHCEPCYVVLCPLHLKNDVDNIRNVDIPMMICGHLGAGSLDDTPVCVHSCEEPDIDPRTPIQWLAILESRIAKCLRCNKKEKSDTRLSAFRYSEYSQYDEWWCGCLLNK